MIFFKFRCCPSNPNSITDNSDNFVQSLQYIYYRSHLSDISLLNFSKIFLRSSPACESSSSGVKQAKSLRRMHLDDFYILLCNRPIFCFCFTILFCDWMITSFGSRHSMYTQCGIEYRPRSVILEITLCRINFRIIFFYSFCLHRLRLSRFCREIYLVKRSMKGFEHSAGSSCEVTPDQLEHIGRSRSENALVPNIFWIILQRKKHI